MSHRIQILVVPLVLLAGSWTAAQEAQKKGLAPEVVPPEIAPSEVLPPEGFEPYEVPGGFPEGGIEGALPHGPMPHGPIPHTPKQLGPVHPAPLHRLHDYGSFRPHHGPTPYAKEYRNVCRAVQPGRVPMHISQPHGPVLYLPWHHPGYYGPRYEGFRPGWFLEGVPAMPLGW